MTSPARTVHDGPVAQPARHRADERRLVGRVGRRGRRRAGAARARLRHQRLDPRADFVLRHFRAEADLRPADPRRQLPVRLQPRPSRALRAQHARSGAGLRRDAGPRPARPGLRRPADRAGRRRCSSAARRAAHRQGRRLFPRRRGAPKPWRRSMPSPPRSAPTREIEIPEAARARAAAYVITAAEGAALHLDRLRTRAGDFDPDVRDRLIAGALVPGSAVDAGAEVPPLVSRRRACAVRGGRCDPRAGDALRRAADRAEDLHAGR